MKKSDRYRYVSGQMYEHHGSRMYDFGGTRLPSVTTILGKTKNQDFIKKWQAKVGLEEADKIKNHSSKRGTSMHKFLEMHVTGAGYDDLSSIGNEARPMAQKIIEVGLAPVSEYYGSEVTMHYPGLYAGSTDLVCLHNDMETIVDFKQALVLRQWKHKFLKRLDMYHELVHDEKERITPMKAEDFNK